MGGPTEKMKSVSESRDSCAPTHTKHGPLALRTKVKMSRSKLSIFLSSVTFFWDIASDTSNRRGDSPEAEESENVHIEANSSTNSEATTILRKACLNWPLFCCTLLFES